MRAKEVKPGGMFLPVFFARGPSASLRFGAAPFLAASRQAPECAAAMAEQHCRCAAARPWQLPSRVSPETGERFSGHLGAGAFDDHFLPYSQVGSHIRGIPSGTPSVTIQVAPHVSHQRTWYLRWLLRFLQRRCQHFAMKADILEGCSRTYSGYLRTSGSTNRSFISEPCLLMRKTARRPEQNLVAAGLPFDLGGDGSRPAIRLQTG